MILSQLTATNYRNLAQVDLRFSPNINCFVGSNGMGKSNVLDAIYYLSFCRGFATVQDGLNVRHDTDFFLLEGDYLCDDQRRQRVVCSLKRGSRKRLRIDGKDVKRISEHLGHIPLVIIAPADAALILGGSEERRRFMDAVIMQYCPAYVEALIRYDRSLKQRNALLKQEEEPDAAVMDVLEELMDADAQTIYEERARFIAGFEPVFMRLHGILAGESVPERVGLSYVSHMQRGALAAQLRDFRSRERIVGYTLHGVHKDELEMTLNGFAIKREASQGQQKTFFIAMKLAQFLYLKSKGEERVPLLLLDDIFDKLDARRVSHIIRYVAGDEFGQIFITDTRRDHLDSLLAEATGDYKLFEVTDGEVREAASRDGAAEAQ